MEELIQKLTPLVLKYKLPLALGVFGLMLFIGGLISLFSFPSEKNDIEFTAADGNVEAVKSAQTKREIAVDVAGAVINPGVYHLAEDSRAQDALVAAGGMSEDADRELVAKILNLAAKVTDGGKVFIPKLGEVVDGSVGSNNNATITGLININTASEGELDTLPGIGPVTAGKIIAGRPYSSVDELLSKKVVSSSVFEKIKEKVSVY